MKILLVIAMSTVLTSAAFGACGKDSAQDCTTRESCEALSSSEANGRRFTFDASRPVKCMVVETSVATSCLENNTASGPKPAAGATVSGSTSGSTNTAK